MNFIQRNVFKQLRSQYFQSAETLDPMTRFKMKKLDWLLKHVSESEAGEVVLATHFLNRKLKTIQNDEHHAIDTSVETVYLLRIIVSNLNAMLNHGVNLKGIIQLGQYLRTRGDKVDFVKLDNWLNRLHIVRLAQLEGSVLVKFFRFDVDEIPFIHRLEKGAGKLTLRSLGNSLQDIEEEWHFRQNKVGFVHNNGRVLRRNLRQSMLYFGYAPMETTFNFLHNFARSLSEIEE